MQNLWDSFVVFILRGPKLQLCESYRIKTAIKPK